MLNCINFWLTNDDIAITISDMSQQDLRALLIARVSVEDGNRADIAARLGISRPYLTMLLSGERPITYRLAMRLGQRYPEIAMAFVHELTSAAVPEKAVS